MCVLRSPYFPKVFHLHYTWHNLFIEMIIKSWFGDTSFVKLLFAIHEECTTMIVLLHELVLALVLRVCDDLFTFLQLFHSFFFRQIAQSLHFRTFFLLHVALLLLAADSLQLTHLPSFELFFLVVVVVFVVNVFLLELVRNVDLFLHGLRHQLSALFFSFFEFAFKLFLLLRHRFLNGFSLQLCQSLRFLHKLRLGQASKIVFFGICVSLVLRFGIFFFLVFIFVFVRVSSTRYSTKRIVVIVFVFVFFCLRLCSCTSFEHALASVVDIFLLLFFLFHHRGFDHRSACRRFVLFVLFNNRFDYFAITPPSTTAFSPSRALQSLQTPVLSAISLIGRSLLLNLGSCRTSLLNCTNRIVVVRTLVRVTLFFSIIRSRSWKITFHFDLLHCDFAFGIANCNSSPGRLNAFKGGFVPFLSLFVPHDEC
eukprot:m.259214 g.259214  ORF g.259214 m.259214 type:complete len:424 (-) comp37704_c0_seq1:368-1639(-)